MWEGYDGRPLDIDARASLRTDATSDVREFEVRDWSVCRVFGRCHCWEPGYERVVVTCEVVSTQEGEWREFQVEYSLRFIRENGLRPEERLIMHARCQIAAELNNVFGFRDLSLGQWPIVISCGV